MRKITNPILQKFYSTHATDEKTLDVGSASGRNKEFFPNSITVDISEDAGPDVIGDAHNLPFEDNSFKCVVCKEMLEHVHDPTVVVSELFRVLEPGGKLILSTRFLFPIHEAPHDHWRFTRFCMERLFKNWSKVSIEEESDPITGLVILIDRLIYQSEFRCNKITKGILFLLTYLFVPFKYLLKKQYGDVTKSIEVPSAFTSGYHVVAYK